ncbi:MAG TPA: hypothetical protein VJB05_00915 [archaeon]|nr:hypothetical protein [archaeon]
MTETRRGNGALHIVPEGILDTRELLPNVRRNVWGVYSIISASSKPMCIDEVQTVIRRRHSYLSEDIDAALEYLLQKSFLVRTARNGITAYDTRCHQEANLVA